jgi:hypothetical protein
MRMHSSRRSHALLNMRGVIEPITSGLQLLN